MGTGVFFSLILFLLLSIVNKVISIKIGFLFYNRIGHLIANTEFWMRKQYENGGMFGRNLFLTGSPANRQVLQMIKRKVPVIESDFFFHTTRYVKRLFPQSCLFMDLEDTGLYSYDVWNKIPPQLSFTKEELKKGEKIVENMGMTPGDPYICFFARDKAYLNGLDNGKNNGDWAYHDYRDSTIENFLPTAKYFGETGVYALRMGAVVEKEILVKHPRVIDYSTKYRSEFADVYLMAHCKFFLGDTGGILYLAEAFNVPCAMVNLIPFGMPIGMSHDLFILKKYRWKKTKQLIPLKKLIDMGADTWSHNEKFEDAGIEIIENSSREILSLAKEMEGRLNNTWKTGDDEEQLQRSYWSLFPDSHPAKGCPALVGTEFLRNNKNLLVNN